MSPQRQQPKDPPSINRVLFIKGSLVVAPYTVVFMLGPVLRPAHFVLLAGVATLLVTAQIFWVSKRGFIFSHNGRTYHHATRTRYGHSRLTDLETGETFVADGLRAYGLKLRYYVLVLIPVLVSLSVFILSSVS